jgi:hypothetical protein
MQEKTARKIRKRKRMMLFRKWKMKQIAKKMGWKQEDLLVNRIEFDKNKGYQMILEHPLFAMFSAGLADIFVNSGATNFLVINTISPKGAFELTIKPVKPGVKTTAKVLEELRNDKVELLEALEKQRKQLLELAKGVIEFYDPDVENHTLPQDLLKMARQAIAKEKRR